MKNAATEYASALESKDIDVQLKWTDGHKVHNVNRTPYNLVSAALALIDEADDLAGDEFLDRIRNRVSGGDNASVAYRTLRDELVARKPKDLSEAEFFAELGHDLIMWAAGAYTSPNVNDNKEVMDNLSMVLASVKFADAQIAGQILMNMTNPWPSESWDAAFKVHWMQVADYMGIEYIDNVRKAGAFMKRFEEWK